MGDETQRVPLKVLSQIGVFSFDTGVFANDVLRIHGNNIVKESVGLRIVCDLITDTDANFGVLFIGRVPNGILVRVFKTSVRHVNDVGISFSANSVYSICRLVEESEDIFILLGHVVYFCGLSTHNKTRKEERLRNNSRDKVCKGGAKERSTSRCCRQGLGEIG